MRRHPVLGFTLIEVMVSLLILSVMALMAWQGVEGISKAREVADGGVKRTLRLQSVMTQWQVDLGAVLDTQTVDPLLFDGATLRLTRRAPSGGMQVVVWALRSGRWVRWAGPPVTTVGQLQEQWTRAMSFQGREPGSLEALPSIDQWQVYFNRGGAWTNAQSSAGTTQRTLGQVVTNNRAPLPRGVRCVLGLGPSSGFEGFITRDVALGYQPNQN
ncbi:MAG TPA: prepilin-type N-terminal cleavage/methylation domain-containing protein [Candidatus Aquabacterium excrementipullorum]|nr:prepilin-type N-terminal cleavage/methylation domain-containing protein [Candidatus Aquabacterium excrementipullorum]